MDTPSANLQTHENSFEKLAKCCETPPLTSVGHSPHTTQLLIIDSLIWIHYNTDALQQVYARIHSKVNWSMNCVELNYCPLNIHNKTAFDFILITTLAPLTVLSKKSGNGLTPTEAQPFRTDAQIDTGQFLQTAWAKLLFIGSIFFEL